jgi:hypothetical protein
MIKFDQTQPRMDCNNCKHADKNVKPEYAAGGLVKCLAHSTRKVEGYSMMNLNVNCGKFEQKAENEKA